MAHLSDSFIDASVTRRLVSAANDDAVAITKSVHDLHQVAEGLSNGDLTEFEPSGVWTKMYVTKSP